MNTLEELRLMYPIFQIIASLVIIGMYFMLKYIFKKIIFNRAIQQNFDPARSVYVRKMISFLIFVIGMTLAGVVWGVSLRGLSFYIASFITVVGVGLFANWSIISNITASVILFFFFPLKIGSKIRIVDGSNAVEGEVLNISLFSIKIKDTEGHHVYYPNNLIMQKYMVHLDSH